MITVTQGGKTLLDDRYPAWKCDVRRNPKHFGLVRVTVKNLPAGATKNIITVDHEYKYVPSFLVAWNYPAGTNPGSASLNQTFGIGILSVSSPVNYSFDYQMGATSFKINAIGGLSDITDAYAEFRYFIFAEDFPLAASSSNFLV